MSHYLLITSSERVRTAELETTETPSVQEEGGGIDNINNANNGFIQNQGPSAVTI